MSVTKLGLYNGVLRACREKRLKSLDENRKPRRLLDRIWTDKNPVRFCLEMSQWQFATKTVKLEPSADVEPDFGFKYAYEKDEDFIRTVAIAFDEYFHNPITRYADEGDYWFSDTDLIYVKYVSDADDYGNNMGLWAPSFQDLVEAFMAKEAVGDLTNSSSLVSEIKEEFEKKEHNAKNKDGVNRPTRFGSSGSWNNARNHGQSQSSRDRVR